MALRSGATLYLGTKDSLLPGKPLIKQLRDRCITHITLPPSALAVIPESELPALQTIIVAGEACSAELIRQWSAGKNFFNAYGPTEATVCATIGKATPKANAKCTDGEKISIGKAIANTQVYILDENLLPVPVGVPGELHIGGVGLARGYLNRPELTQEKFISNPFRRSRGDTEGQSFNSERLYKTGDLARYLPDGNIEYLGRIDNQVKIRGFRIELGEIEALLSQHTDVQICCVIAREETPGNKRLVAYVVPQKDVTLTTGELRQFVSNKLPGYMLPTAFACSTSLVAVHVACQSLLNGECDIALAGGVTLSIPQKIGYLHQEGMILSPDGHCRAFDAKAQGTIAGSGAGIVVLKRLKDAISDRDYIHAIIKGSAINNDGAMKVGYTAPSVSGQAAVIGEAQALAGVDAETISYIEAHGTATPLGDPIEIAALTQAFNQTTDKKGFCAIGSLKTNLGHLDTAAGVAGLIKTVLALNTFAKIRA